MPSLLKCSHRTQVCVIFTIMSLISTFNQCLDELLSFFGKTLVLLILSYLLTFFMRIFGIKELVSSDGKAVLITGCDSGFGNRMAYRLNQNGFRVFATVLSEASEGSKQLIRSAVFEDKMHILEMDVTNEDRIRLVYDEIRKELYRTGDQLWAVVNNAGMFAYGPIEWDTVYTYERVFDVNVFGTVRVTRIFLPLIKISRGRVVNIASLAGRVSSSSGGVYCMSERANIAFTECLRREMYEFGVNVSSIEPGFFKTQMTSQQNLHRILDNAYNKTDNVLYLSYGHQYFDSQRQTVTNFDKYYKSGDNIDIVVEDMMDAVQNIDPKPIYRPIEGLKNKFLILLLMCLPIFCMDYILDVRHRFITRRIVQARFNGSKNQRPK